MEVWKTTVQRKKQINIESGGSVTLEKLIPSTSYEDDKKTIKTRKKKVNIEPKKL